MNASHLPAETGAPSSINNSHYWKGSIKRRTPGKELFSPPILSSCPITELCILRTFAQQTVGPSTVQWQQHIAKLYCSWQEQRRASSDPLLSWRISPWKGFVLSWPRTKRILAGSDDLGENQSQWVVLSALSCSMRLNWKIEGDGREDCRRNSVCI